VEKKEALKILFVLLLLEVDEQEATGCWSTTSF
jgi:hypothetical protein